MRRMNPARQDSSRSFGLLRSAAPLVGFSILILMGGSVVQYWLKDRANDLGITTVVDEETSAVLQLAPDTPLVFLAARGPWYHAAHCRLLRRTRTAILLSKVPERLGACPECRPRLGPLEEASSVSDAD